ncbi:MAG: tetratricopeptide repeat protein, partial [Armatimonadetes bacterium]|nr:tetratricopeptide repeat protein [Armatimonadota bacterium]
YQEDLRNRAYDQRAEVYNALGRAYYFAGRYMDAIEALGKCLQFDENYLEAIYYRGLTWYRLDDYEKALKDFKRGEDIVKEWDMLNTRLEKFLQKEESTALSAREQRRKQETQEQLAQEYNRATEFLTIKAMRHDLHIARGDAADAAGDYALARNSYRDVLDVYHSGDPSNALAHTKIGLAYLHEAKHTFYDKGLLHKAIRMVDEAIAKIEEAISYDDNFAMAHAALGDIYFFQAETYVSDPEREIVSHTYEDALDEYGKAISADPNLVVALVNRARTYIAMGQPTRAVADLQQALNIAPRDPDLYAVAASAYCVAQDYENAINTAATALSLESDNAEALNTTGLAYYFLGELPLAAEHFTKAIRADKTKHQYYTNLGNTYFQMGSWNRARKEYQKALDIIPDSTIANTAYQRSYLLYLVARTHHFQHHYEQEVEALNKALTLDPAYLEALLQLADAHTELEQYRAAETDLRLALEKSPDEETDARIHTQLGRLFEREGQLHKAIAHYGSALKAARAADIESPEAEEALQRLQAG